MITAPAALIETHAAIVFFVGDRAYKLKKPVDLGFLDFRRRADRERVCRRETELNRRMAPDVYLGVADLRGPDGEILDHFVVMRRLPADRRLSTLVRSGVPVDDDLRHLARLLAAFHARARRGPAISAEGTRDALLGRWDATFRMLRPFAGGVLEAAAAAEVERLCHAFLLGRAPLFHERVADGRIVDGHGDLIADDVFCLPDGPRALDCLEFDDRLRYLDGLDDAAFLAMDLEHLGAAGPAVRFLDRYAQFSGDPAPVPLRHHYLAYRAYVRAKVGCLRHAQGDPAAAADVRSYTDLTLRHLRAGEVRLILVGGSPGTGKSTLAGRLADRLGAVLLASDRIRKELAGLVPTAPAAAPYRQGLYTAERTELTYGALLELAERLLERGETVVLDASWTAGRHRRGARELAALTHSGLFELRCTADAEVVADRLAHRRAGPSDAGPAVAAAMAAETDPWPEAAEIPTGDRPDHSLDRALGVLTAGHRG